MRARGRGDDWDVREGWSPQWGPEHGLRAGVPVRACPRGEAGIWGEGRGRGEGQNLG